MALPYVNNIYFILFFRVGKGCEEEGGGAQATCRWPGVIPP